MSKNNDKIKSVKRKYDRVCHELKAANLAVKARDEIIADLTSDLEEVLSYFDDDDIKAELVEGEDDEQVHSSS